MIRPNFQRATAISFAAHILVMLLALIMMLFRPHFRLRAYTVNLVSSPPRASAPARAREERRTPPPKKAAPERPERTLPPKKRPAMALKKDPVPDAATHKKKAIEELRAKKEAEIAEAHRQDAIEELAKKKRLESIRERVVTSAASVDEGAAEGGRRDEVMHAYSESIMSKIRDNWLFPDVGLGVRTEVSVTVFADGSIRINRITTPSGNRAFDQSVLKAIIKTGSVDPPPFGRNEEVMLNFIPVAE